MNDLTTRSAIEKDDDIDLLDLFFYLRQHLLYLVLVFVLGAVLAVAGSYFLITPTFEASAEIYIVSASNNSVVNLSDLQIGTVLTTDYEDLMVSRPMMESVLQELDLDCTVEALRSMIDIENPDDTRILKITVTTTDPTMSASIANKVSELAIEWIPSIMECEPPNIVEEALPPTEKAGPSLKTAAMYGSFGALFIAVAVYCVRYLLNDSIRSGEDLERYFAMTPLASIPEDRSNPTLRQKKDSKKIRSKRRVGEVAVS